MDAVKKVLVLNYGSSSLKWSLLDAKDEATLQAGHEPWKESDLTGVETLRSILKRFPKPDAVGHRIVHGGNLFKKAIRIDPGSLAKLKTLVVLDPLHMGTALAAVDAITAELPGTPQFASFDTAFHATLPEAAAGYALPYEWIQKWSLRRYGFHGLSVEYSSQKTKEWMGSIPGRLIVCHLGSGSSVTAVEKGRSVDTTMGFTPLEGLVMATRSGSVDPGLLFYLQRHHGIKTGELEEVLYYGSGLLGVSGVSGDLREVLAAADKGSAPSVLAYGLFLQSVRRAIGSMLAVLGGVDALVFTGGIGENQYRVRRDLTSTLAYAGIHLDAEVNRSAATDREISEKDSMAKIWVIRSREDLMILRELLQCEVG